MRWVPDQCLNSFFDASVYNYLIFYSNMYYTEVISSIKSNKIHRYSTFTAFYYYFIVFKINIIIIITKSRIMQDIFYRPTAADIIYKYTMRIFW